MNTLEEAILTNGGDLARAYRPGRSQKGVSYARTNDTDSFFGAQLGLNNRSRYGAGTMVGLSNQAQTLDGLQIGGYTETFDELQGAQIGLLCVGPKKGTYVQLGLLTFRPFADRWYKRISPLFGFSREKT